MKFTLLLLLLLSCAHRAPAHQTGVSLLQLSTTDNSVEFNLLLEKTKAPQMTILTATGQEYQAAHEMKSERATSDWAVFHFKFTKIPQESGDYQVVVKNQGKVLDQRSFGLFSSQGEKLRFIVGSCADLRTTEQGKVWRTVAQLQPEWLFMIGDNLYAVQGTSEVESAEVLWERYVESRRALDLYRLKRLIPTQAIWDDNDYGQKDGGASYSLREESQNIFRTFFQSQFGADNFITGPGVASRLQLRGMHFNFLDNRSFRDKDDVNGEHFGKEQEEWLWQDLKSAQLPTWIISGDQFFGGYHQFDSYEGRHPRAFENFISKMKEITTPYVFLSGDRHLTELMQFPRAILGQLSFELTVSPFHGKIYPGRGMSDQNPWRVVGRDDQLNFALVETWLETSSWNMSIQSINQLGEVLFRRELSLTTEALKDFQIEKRQRRRRYRRARLRR